MDGTNIIFYLIFVGGAIFLFLMGVIQIVRARKEEYNNLRLSSAFFHKKMLKTLSLLSVLVVAWFLFLIIKYWNGLWSLVLIFFAFSIEFITYSTYYYYSSYCKKYSDIGEDMDELQSKS